MKIKKNVLGVAAIAAVAFTVGRLGLPLSNQSTAIAQDQGEMEMTPEQKAWMKAATPGQHHRYLDALVGDFTADVKIWMTPDSEPMEFTGTLKREWVLDGHFIMETIKADSPMGPFEAICFIGYNNIDGQYESIWLENASTAITSGSGNYDAETKTLRMMSKYRDPATGHLITSWNKADLSDPYRETSTGWQVGADGKEFKSFEGVFVREQ